MNKKFALLFAGAILLLTSALVGKGGAISSIAETSNSENGSQPIVQPSQSEFGLSSEFDAEPYQTGEGFSQGWGEDVPASGPIDSTQGFDPTPTIAQDYRLDDGFERERDPADAASVRRPVRTADGIKIIYTN